MATKPYRQNLTGAQGTTLTGAHGGTQQLGAAAQRRLQAGQSSAQQPAGPPPGARTPPPFDPATLKPGAGGRDPATGGMLSFPGGPGQISFPGVPGVPGVGGGRLPLPPGDMMNMDGRPGMYPDKFPGGAPGIASMDGAQNGQAGPPGMFGRVGQQLGVQGPGDAGNIDNAISNLRSQLGIAGPDSPPTGYGNGTPPNYTNYMSGENAANLGQFTRNAKPWTGGVSFGASPGIVPTGAGPTGQTGKPFTVNGAGGVAQQQPQPTNPYAALLRSRLLGGGGGTGLGAIAGALGGASSLRGY